MSHAEWLCRKCTGANGRPLRNWSANKACHRCKEPKAKVFLKYYEPAIGDTTSASKSKGSELVRLKAQVDKDAKARRALEAELKELKKARDELSAATGGGLAATGTEEPSGLASAAIDLLREHIKTLSGIPGTEVVVAAKQAQLDKLVQARSEAKPVGVRIKNIEGFLDRKRKVRERLDGERADLQKKLAAAQEKVTENAKAIQSVDEEIKGLEAQRAALYQSRVEEASAAAELSQGTSPEVGGNILAAFLGGLPNEVHVQAGTTKEEVDGVLGKLGLLCEFGRRHWAEVAAGVVAGAAAASGTSFPATSGPGAANAECPSAAGPSDFAKALLNQFAALSGPSPSQEMQLFADQLRGFMARHADLDHGIEAGSDAAMVGSAASGPTDVWTHVQVFETMDRLGLTGNARLAMEAIGMQGACWTTEKAFATMQAAGYPGSLAEARGCLANKKHRNGQQ